MSMQEPRAPKADRPLPGTIGATWLVGDVGATNARFGLVSPDGAVLHSSNLACADFAEIGEALDAYLAMRGDLPMPRQGALAIAALITGDLIRMTKDRKSTRLNSSHSQISYAVF